MSLNKKALWISDIHAEKLNYEQVSHLIQSIQACKASEIWLTGDIGEPPHNQQFLSKLLKAVQIPVYFVLGNHDYYGVSKSNIAQQMHAIMHRYSHSKYLTCTPPIIGHNTLLTGIDAWADNQYLREHEQTKDGLAIKDFQTLSGYTLQKKLEKWAQEDAQLLLRNCNEWLTPSIHTVHILTHVPPSLAEKSINTENNHLKEGFYSQALSQVIQKIACQYPDKSINIYSGHRHCRYEYQVSEHCLGYINTSVAKQTSFMMITL